VNFTSEKQNTCKPKEDSMSIHVWRSKEMKTLHIYNHKVLVETYKGQVPLRKMAWVCDVDCITVSVMKDGYFNPMNRVYVYNGTVDLGIHDYVELNKMSGGRLELNIVLKG
jgi:hypothetical protein